MFDKDTFKSFELEYELRKEADQIYQRYNRADFNAQLLLMKEQEIEEVLDDDSDIDLEDGFNLDVTEDENE
jgi:hypothetical protein